MAVVAMLAVPAAGAQLPLAPPTVTTEAATSVTSTSAVLEGTVNPNGTETAYAFQWGTSDAYGNEAPLPLASAGDGKAAKLVGAKLTGLRPGTSYHFRIIALSLGGVSTGADQSFTTSGTSPPPPAAPRVITGPAQDLSSSSALLTGTVNPAGSSTTYHFEYGTTSAYGFETAPASAGSGTGAVPASARLTGLAPNTVYHFRLVADSAGGTTVGNDATFRTSALPPVVSKAQVIGRTGFVSPAGWVGITVACFGQTKCAGRLLLTHARRRIGARSFALAADRGAVERLRLDPRARSLLRRKRRLQARIVLSTITGQRLASPFQLIAWGR
jgi:hypothetical protein